MFDDFDHYNHWISDAIIDLAKTSWVGEVPKFVTFIHAQKCVDKTLVVK